MFSADNATSLSDATLALIRDLVSRKPRRAEFEYADATSVYERILSTKQNDGSSIPIIDLRLLESAISRLEDECWPSRECKGG